MSSFGKFPSSKFNSSSADLFKLFPKWNDKNSLFERELNEMIRIRFFKDWVQELM